MVDMAICARCKNDLTEEEKDMGIPVCQNCIELLVGTVTDKFKRSEGKKFEEDVDNFSRFIISSGKLFRLDDIVIVQCLFNIFMSEVVHLENNNLALSQKIFRDSIKFIERELEKIEEKKKGRSSNPSDSMISAIDELIKKGMKSRDGNNDKKEYNDDRIKDKSEDKKVE